MPEMPVFCDKCGLIFGSGFVFENTTNVTLKGNRRQCPRCHHMAEIPNGLFNFVNDAIEIINAPKLTIDKLSLYKEIIEKLKDSNADYDEIKSTIEKSAPELNGLISFFPKTRTELYGFLMLILATITFSLNQIKDDDKKTINVNNVINYYNTNYTKNDNSVDNSIKTVMEEKKWVEMKSVIVEAESSTKNAMGKITKTQQ